MEDELYSVADTEEGKIIFRSATRKTITRSLGMDATRSHKYFIGGCMYRSRYVIMPIERINEWDRVMEKLHRKKSSWIWRRDI